MPAVKAFGGTYKRLTKRTSDMLKADLAATEVRDNRGEIVEEAIPYIDKGGRYAEFHSLRHTTGSLLAAAGTHPKVAQSIMRHSSIDLTMSRYTHVLRGQESEAIAGLPDFSLPSSQNQQATGTEGRAAETAPKELTPKLTPFLTPTAFPACNRLSAVGTVAAFSVLIFERTITYSRLDICTVRGTGESEWSEVYYANWCGRNY